jgi:hypothetical protein
MTMRDPEQHRTPWIGAIRLVAEFELEMGPEDDVCDAETARTVAREQLQEALSAVVICPGLSTFAREILSTWSDVVVVSTDEDPPPYPKNRRPKS